MTSQPEARRLAELIRSRYNNDAGVQLAAAEMCRQDTEIERLQQLHHLSSLREQLVRAERDILLKALKLILEVHKTNDDAFYISNNAVKVVEGENT